MWKLRLPFLTGAVSLTAAVISAQTRADADAVGRIRDEGQARSEAPALFGNARR